MSDRKNKELAAEEEAEKKSKKNQTKNSQGTRAAISKHHNEEGLYRACMDMELTFRQVNTPAQGKKKGREDEKQLRTLQQSLLGLLEQREYVAPLTLMRYVYTEAIHMYVDVGIYVRLNVPT